MTWNECKDLQHYIVKLRRELHPIPAWLVIVCSVFGTVAIARVFYPSENKKAAK